MVTSKDGMMVRGKGRAKPCSKLPPKPMVRLMAKLEATEREAKNGGTRSKGLTKRQISEIHRIRREHHPHNSFICTHEPDPHQLMAVTPCKYCKLPRLPARLGNGILEKMTVDWYNAVRRSFKADHGLTSILAPLTKESADQILEVGRKYGIASNKALVHVTFVEGLLPIAKRSGRRPIRDQQIEGVRSAFRSWPTFQVLSAKCVPTLNYDSMLVVLTLQYMSDTVIHALQPLLHQARMPQWPLHCAVGIVDKHKADASAAKLASTLQGTVLSLQPESIRELVATQPATERVTAVSTSASLRTGFGSQRKKLLSSSER